MAEKPLPEPVEKDIVEAVPKKGVIGKVFKKEAQIVMQKLSELSLDDISTMEAQLAEKGYDLHGKNFSNERFIPDVCSFILKLYINLAYKYYMCK